MVISKSIKSKYFSPTHFMLVVVERKTDGSKESLIDGSTLISPETYFLISFYHYLPAIWIGLE